MYYGFDIGGSKIALGVFDKARRLQWEKRVATPKESYEAFLQAVEELVEEADQRFGCQGSVGIGIPGMPETEDGTLYAANVPAASGRRLRADLSERLGRDVRLDNDANCFALSEAWDDEFTQYPLVMGMILGTGVGGGWCSTENRLPGIAILPANSAISACQWMRWRWWDAIFRLRAAAAASWAALKITFPDAASPGCMNIFTNTL